MFYSIAYNINIKLGPRRCDPGGEEHRSISDFGCSVYIHTNKHTPIDNIKEFIQVIEITLHKNMR